MNAPLTKERAERLVRQYTAVTNPALAAAVVRDMLDTGGSCVWHSLSRVTGKPCWCWCSDCNKSKPVRMFGGGK